MPNIPIEQSDFIVAAGTATTAGGAAAETFTVNGARTGDTVIASLKTEGSSAVTLDAATISAANTLSITFSADPSTDHVISYAVFRNRF